MASATTIWVVDADGEPAHHNRGHPRAMRGPRGGLPRRPVDRVHSYHLVYLHLDDRGATPAHRPGRGLDVQTLAFTPEGRRHVVWSGSPSKAARRGVSPADRSRARRARRRTRGTARTTDGKFEGAPSRRNGTVAWSTALHVDALWTMPVAGDGTAGDGRSSSIVRQTFPRFSPDGSRIVYTENRALRPRSGQGISRGPTAPTRRELTSGLPPKGISGWSPDGRRVYFLLGPRLGWIDIATPLAPQGSSRADRTTSGSRQTDSRWRITRRGRRRGQRVRLEAEQRHRQGDVRRRGGDYRCGRPMAGASPSRSSAGTCTWRWCRPAGITIRSSRRRRACTGRTRGCPTATGLRPPGATGWNLCAVVARTRERRLTRFDEVNGCAIGVVSARRRPGGVRALARRGNI